MAVLWELGSGTVAEVRKLLPDELAYTTVLTVLRTLEKKGYVVHEEEGKAHRYLPAVERQTARDSALKRITRKLLSGSPELLMAQLVAWMVYSVVVSCLVVVAAEALDAVARPLRRPTRWIWLGALGTALGLPTLRSLFQALSSAPAPVADLPAWAPQVILDPITNTVAREAMALRLTPVLAVVGFFNSIIVLPRWCREVDPDRQDLILAHEREHLRAGDLRVLFISFLAVLAMPWPS